MNRTVSRLEIVISALVILICCFIFDNKKQQSDVWLAPYFSGASNLDMSLDWRYSPKESVQFQGFSEEEKLSYRFKKHPESDLDLYDYNSKGFLYWVFIAKQIFFWTGDIVSIEYLHIAIFVLLSILFLTRFQLLSQRLILLLLFSLNPLIIHFVTFPYNFFWQIVVSVLILVTLLLKKPSFFSIILISIVIGLSVATRPTTIFLALAYLTLILFKEECKQLHKLIAIVLVISIIFLLPNSTRKNPWFTMFIGLGAYQNEYVAELSDNEGYAYFEQATGVPLNASIGGNYYENEIQEEFLTVFKKRYVEILRSNPGLILKNAIVNTLQGFSIGYLTNKPDWINYLIAFSGMLIMIIFLYYRQYLVILMILMNNVGFTLYYPPIPAYMYGAYPFLIFGFVTILNKMLGWHQPKFYFKFPILFIDRLLNPS